MCWQPKEEALEICLEKCQKDIDNAEKGIVQNTNLERDKEASCVPTNNAPNSAKTRKTARRMWRDTLEKSTWT